MWDAIVITWGAVGTFLADLIRLSNPLWFYWPLCAVVALVYKSTKFDTPRDIARGALHFFASVTAGMFILGVLFYMISRFL
jgi:hypothetical protein